MTALTTRTRVVLGVALVVPAVMSLWRIAVAEIVTPSAYAIGSAILLAAAATVLLRAPAFGRGRALRRRRERERISGRAA